MLKGLRQRIFPPEWHATISKSFPTVHDLIFAMLSTVPSERPTSAVVASHIDSLVGEFVFSLDRGYERKEESALLLRVEACDVDGILPRTINMIKAAAPSAHIAQYGLKGQGSKAIMEFALTFSSDGDEKGSADCSSSAQLDIFRTLNASDEIQLVRQVTADLCPNRENLDMSRKLSIAEK